MSYALQHIIDFLFWNLFPGFLTKSSGYTCASLVVVTQTRASTESARSTMSVRHCGMAVNGRVCVMGSNGHKWPSYDEAPFSYTSKNGDTRHGKQLMKGGLPTTEFKHELACYYPIKDTIEAAQVVSIEGESATVLVKFNGCDTVVKPQKRLLLLSSLLLVDEYTTLNGIPRTTQASSVPRIASTPPKTGLTPRMGPIRGELTVAIVVGWVTEVADIHSKLVQLSPDAKDAVTLAITHEEVHPESLVLRKFSDMKEISDEFYKQGIMDEGNQGLSCGVEAVNNTGFKVTASSFNQQAAIGVDKEDFMVAEGERPRNHDGDDYLEQTGGGNNITCHEMFLTMKTLVEEQGMKMNTSPMHHIKDSIGTPEFWVGHQWAIVQIPVCGGHWVSMEKIMYKDQPAVCLREGRGKVTYDFTTSPADRARLRAGVAGMGTGKKRKH